MNAAGIIVEYNPFHKGHAYHLEKTRELTGHRYVAAVMSGNFVQRGEPAICDKWRRTRMALMQGVDLVIELPVYYAAAGADYFARGAVKLLDAAGIIDTLCFGSESGDIEAIREAGRILADEPAAYKKILRKTLSGGASFPSARAAALEAVLERKPEGLLNKPNNTLGIEYCRNLYRINSGIIPVSFLRKENEGQKPAAHIRAALHRGRLREAEAFMPPAAFTLLREACEKKETAHLNGYSKIFHYLLRSLRPLPGIDLSEGLENRFYKLSKDVDTVSGLLKAVKTRRYTYTRLQRIVLHIVLGLTKEALREYEDNGGPQYIRVLGFRKESAELLSEMARRAALPVITHINRAGTLAAPARSMLRKEIEAGDIYSLAWDGLTKEIGYEYREPLVVV